VLHVVELVLVARSRDRSAERRRGARARGARLGVAWRLTRARARASVGRRGAVSAIVVVVAPISLARQFVPKSLGEARAGSDGLLTRIDLRLLILPAVTASTASAASTSTSTALVCLESAAGHFVTDIGRLDVVFRIDIVGHHRHRRRRREAVATVIPPACIVGAPLIARPARSTLIALAAAVALMVFVARFTRHTLVARLTVFTLVAAFALVTRLAVFTRFARFATVALISGLALG
jgi:hypothetical protein